MKFYDLRPLSGNSKDGWGWVRDRERVKFNERKLFPYSCTTGGVRDGVAGEQDETCVYL